MTLHCASCGAALEPGEALRVRILASGVSYPLHRYSLRSACFGKAGPAGATAVTEWDPAAAREYDHRTGGVHHDDREVARIKFMTKVAANRLDTWQGERP